MRARPLRHLLTGGAICTASFALVFALVGCRPLDSAPSPEMPPATPPTEPLVLPGAPDALTVDEEAAVALMRHTLPEGGLSDDQFVLLYRSADTAIGSSAQQTTIALDEVVSLWNARIIPHDIAVSQFAALAARVHHDGSAEQREALRGHPGCARLIPSLC